MILTLVFSTSNSTRTKYVELGFLLVQLVANLYFLYLLGTNPQVLEISVEMQQVLFVLWIIVLLISIVAVSVNLHRRKTQITDTT